MMLRLPLGLCLFCLCLSSGAEEDPLAALKKGQPAEVAEMIERLVGCSHWAGEEPYDAERKKEIAEALKELKCNSVSRDEAALKKRYATRREVIEALKKAREWNY
jgi:hypothetical protein